MRKWIIILVVACIIIATGVAGSKLGTRHTPEEPVEAISVEYLQYNRTLAYIKVDFIHSSLVSIRRKSNDNGGVYEYVTTNLSPTQIQNVSIPQQLRGFTPHEEWFTTGQYFDMGAVLAIRWSDGTTSFALPFGNMLDSVPEKAKSSYAIIDALVYEMGTLDKKYWQSSSVEAASSNHPVIVEFTKSRKKIVDISLPANRVGW